jgi:D-serine deaminase-like pyridoxal phosphate-dependent protein
MSASPHDLTGMPKDALETPALLVDLDFFELNVARIAEACRQASVYWRPHVKSVKVPEIAQLLISAGAHGVTCATLGEAETMAAGGIDNILIANQVVGDTKISRLVELSRRRDVIVSVDGLENVRELAAAASVAGTALSVVIEVDIGLQRAGVQPGEAVVRLARAITAQPTLRFRGLMAWEGQTTTIVDEVEKAAAISAAIRRLTSSAEQCREAGMAVEIVSCGGTGTFVFTAREPGITEIQAGGGVFGDVRYRTKFNVDLSYALTVMATVTSRPNPQRIICDAGKKAMSGDAALPSPLQVGPVESITLSAEHTRLELPQPSSRPAVGDKLEFVVGYSDTTVHLYDEIYAIRDDKVERVFRLPPRRRP